LVVLGQILLFFEEQIDEIDPRKLSVKLLNFVRFWRNFSKTIEGFVGSGYQNQKLTLLIVLYSLPNNHHYS
jgi:hypothetical protein